MSRSVYKYRIYCNTESSYIYMWNNTTPSVCPNDISHSISTSTVSIIEEVQESTVSIKQETTPTGGNFKSKGYVFTASANTVTTYGVSWPFPISAMAVHIQTDSTHIGDYLDAVLAPFTVVGANTSTGLIGENTLVVSSTVFENALIGYECFVASEYLGNIVAMDISTLTITFSNSLSQEYAPGNYISIQVRIIENHPLGMQIGNDIGVNNIGGKYLPANMVTNIMYTNNSIDAKTCRFTIEYLY